MDSDLVLETFPPSDGQVYEEENDYWRENFVWWFMWTCTMVAFLVCPLCTSKRRREMCKLGLRERRWISDEEYDELEENARTENRRQQREETQRQFQTTKTQEDDIRQQYLSYLMQNYSISIKESDICDCQTNGEKIADDTDESSTGEVEKEADSSEVDNRCDTTVVSSNIESFDTKDSVSTNNHVVDIEAPPETSTGRERVNSEDSDDLLEVAFDHRQTVCVPFPGQSIRETELSESNSAIDRRAVSNGCAICLCPFEEDEKITWSSNPDCCHVFHHDCILNWYLAVGRKTQKRRKRNNPEMTPEEALDLICEFPILCPCCRQEFCLKEDSTTVDKDEEAPNDVSDEEVENAY